MGTGCTKLTYWNILPNNGWYKATVLWGYNADNSGNISWNIVRPVISHRYMEMYAHLIDDSPILKIFKNDDVPVRYVKWQKGKHPQVGHISHWWWISRLCSRTFLLQHLDSGLPCLHPAPKTKKGEPHLDTEPCYQDLSSILGDLRGVKWSKKTCQ